MKALLLLFPAFFLGTMPAAAQVLRPPGQLAFVSPDEALQVIADSHLITPSARLELVTDSSYPEVFLGTGLGLVLGTALGVGAGLLVYELTQQHDGWGPIGEVAVGASVGAAVGTFAGARIANRGRGNPWATAAGSVLGVAGGIGLGLLAADATESTNVGLMVTIPIAITLPALSELLITR